MSAQFAVAIVGSGPAGLSAGCRAAEQGLDHVVLEAAPQLSNTVFRFQKGKHVMAEPGVLPLRSSLPFEAGRREAILAAWNQRAQELGVHIRHAAEVTRLQRDANGFLLGLNSDLELRAAKVVLAIGLQGNLRKLGVSGDDLPGVQYQLDDPGEYQDEIIVVVGAGDAAIENALALADNNRVIVVNRRDEFTRAKDGNNTAILAAIKQGRLECYYDSKPERVQASADGSADGRPLTLYLTTRDGGARIECDRIIARLGAIPPRKFVESCGVEFPNTDPNSVPVVSSSYESNVQGLYIVGALAGYPLIKQALNQGYEVIEHIQGHAVIPVDEPLLREKLAPVPGPGNAVDVDLVLDVIRSRIRLLRPLTPLQLREFMLESFVRVYESGETIFQRNDYSNSFFSLLSGTAEVLLGAEDTGKAARITAGRFFGEMSLISGRRRSATVRAASRCIAIETPRRQMNKLIQSVEGVRRIVDRAFVTRAIQAHLAPEAEADVLAPLAESADAYQFKADELIYAEGEPSDCIHLIRRGSVMVSREVAGRTIVLAYMPAGNYFGETGILSSQVRGETVRAATATETIRLDATEFLEVIRENEVVRKAVERVYKSRLMSESDALMQARRGGESAGELMHFLMDQGLGEATDALLIDESLCIRCDQCEKACAATHGNVSRLNREAGPTFANLHVPTSCRHCEHPHCMKDCPPDAIHRLASGEVYIDDSCIGCGNCEQNCPYGVIQMGVESAASPSLWQWLLLGRGEEPGAARPLVATDAAKRAVKCDMCKDRGDGPACVQSCPTGAAIRVKPEQFMAVIADG